MFERYEKRTREHPDFDFDNMTLMEFSIRFQPYYAKKQEEENYDDSIDQDAYNYMPQQTRRRLMNLINRSKMSIRNEPVVVRVPFFMATSDPENFIYSILLQYMPFPFEQELLEGFDSARETFLA